MRKNLIIGLGLVMSLIALSNPLMAEDTKDSQVEDNTAIESSGWNNVFKDYKTVTEQYRNKVSEEPVKIMYTLYRNGEAFIENDHILDSPFAVIETIDRVGKATQSKDGTLLEPQTITNGLLFYQNKNKIVVKLYNEEKMIYQTDFKKNNPKEQSRLLGNYKIIFQAKTDFNDDEPTVKYELSENYTISLNDQ